MGQEISRASPMTNDVYLATFIRILLLHATACSHLPGQRVERQVRSQIRTPQTHSSLLQLFILPFNSPVRIAIKFKANEKVV